MCYYNVCERRLERARTFRVACWLCGGCFCAVNVVSLADVISMRSQLHLCVFFRYKKQKQKKNIAVRWKKTVGAENDRGENLLQCKLTLCYFRP